MKANNIVTAPQATEINRLFEVWRRDHAGNKQSFYQFMTAPTEERDRFIRSLTAHIRYIDGVIALTVSIPLQ